MDARFTGLLEAAPDAMVCVEADGRIALVNAQVLRMFGYSRAELVGQPVEVLVPEDARAFHSQYVRVLLMSGYTQGLLSAQGVLKTGVGLIEKPFSEPALLTKLSEILSQTAD